LRFGDGEPARVANRKHLWRADDAPPGDSGWRVPRQAASFRRPMVS